MKSAFVVDRKKTSTEVFQELLNQYLRAPRTTVGHFDTDIEVIKSEYYLMANGVTPVRLIYAAEESEIATELVAITATIFELRRFAPYVPPLSDSPNQARQIDQSQFERICVDFFENF